jgi:hypothetical protein
MINKTIVAELFKKQYPDLMIESIHEWDPKTLLVIAPPVDKKDALDPYYKVNKLTGLISPFYPGEDIVKFGKLMSNSGGGK